MSTTRFIERSILNRLLEIADRRGLYPASVQYEDGDGVRFPARHLTPHHAHKVLEAVEATELAWLHLHDKTDSRRHSTWLLVLGNGEDIIADHTAGEVCNAMFNYALREVAA